MATTEQEIQDAISQEIQWLEQDRGRSVTPEEREIIESNERRYADWIEDQSRG